MKTPSHTLVILTIVLTQHSQAKILRNNALMTEMMAHFQDDNTQSVEPTEQEHAIRDRGENLHEIPRERYKEPASQTPRERHKNPQGVLTVLQNVLCRNFPSIPCSLIMEDQTLRQLMEQSIQQVYNKKMVLTQATIAPKYLTLFPIANSGNVVNSKAGYFRDRTNSRNRRKKNKAPKTMKNFWSHERIPKKKIKGFEESKRSELFTTHKKIRKFYPHKIKHKDKSIKNTKINYRDSEEKLSMSLEAPEMTLDGNDLNKDLYGVAEDHPVWRIDYMKHGEPSLNMFDYDDRLKGKIVRAGPNVVVDEAVLEQASRRDVLHPDLVIKRKFTRAAARDAALNESTD